MSDTMSDYLKKNLKIAAPDDSALDVYNLMKRNQIRHIPVVENGQAVGIISDRDLSFVSATGESFNLRAKDVMTPAPYSVDALTSAAHVVNIMAQKKISSVLVHDENKKLAGIFTSADALGILAQKYKEESAKDEKESKEAMRPTSAQV